MILRVDPKGFYLYWTYQNKVSAKASQLGLQIASSSLRKIKHTALRSKLPHSFRLAGNLPQSTLRVLCLFNGRFVCLQSSRKEQEIKLQTCQRDEHGLFVLAVLASYTCKVIRCASEDFTENSSIDIPVTQHAKGFSQPLQWCSWKENG